MCFADPARVLDVEGDTATVDVDGVTTSAGLSVVRAQGVEIAPGDWVLLALGLVLERISEADGLELSAVVAGLGRR